MSKAKAKGTKGENEIVDLLVGAGFPRADPDDPNSVGVKRFEGGHESHDIQGVGDWVIEVKFRKAWHLYEWICRIRKRAGEGKSPVRGDTGFSLDVWHPQPWVIFAIHGDRNTKVGRQVRRVAIMDADMAAHLIRFWESQ